MRNGLLGAVACLAVASVVSSCRSHRLTPEEEFRFLFSGYTLIRTGSISQEDSLIDGGLASLRDSLSLGVTLTSGRAYAFRKDADWPNEQVALQILPERLNVIGARIVSRPLSVKDLSYAVAGGPFFRIDFRKNDGVGIIFNRLVRSTEGPAGTEVLVVIYRKPS
jgi:hypothetical protein